MREKASYVLEQGDIRFVVSGALDADSPIAEHVRKHGDGVHDLAWMVDDATAVYEAAVARGARSVRAPWTETDERRHAGAGPDRHLRRDGPHVRRAAPATRGTVLEPGYGTDNLPPTPVGPEVGLIRIDHVVGNVEKGKLDDWVRFYAEVIGFGQLVHFDDSQIATEYSALDVHGRVGRLQDRDAHQRAGRRQEEEPDPGVRRHLRRARRAAHRAAHRRHRRHGAGAARPGRALHDACRTRTTTRPRERLAEFDLPWAELQRLNILADKDFDGYLLQIFTETITDRPTVFFEIIERRGAKGFGEGNFKALFEAIERDQDRRGNL